MIFIMITLLQLINGGDTLTCLSCRNLAQPYDCDRVIECGVYENCYTERHITDDGNIYYNVGCKDTSRCVDKPFTKRSSILCSKCCSSDICNMHSTCRSKDVPRTKGQKFCYSCGYGKPKPVNCNKIQVCARNEMCHIRKQYNAFGETRWVTGCAQRAQCKSLHNCLDYCCCESDLCNKNCSSSVASMISTPHHATNHPTNTPGQHPSIQKTDPTYSMRGSTTVGYTSTIPTTRKPNFQKTIIFFQELTVSGQDMFIQGGIDKRHRQGCVIPVASRDSCAIPIRSRNLGTSTHFSPYNAWRKGDNFLDWHRWEPHQGVYNGKHAQGTPAVWTTNRQGDSRYNDQNTYGEHYWLVDIDMDCDKTINGWFEVRAVLNYQHERIIPASQNVCNKMKAPYESIYHWARCGMKNVFHFNQAKCSIIPIK